MSGLIGTLIAIIIMLIILGVIWWAIQQLLPLMPIAEPFHTIIRVLLMVILVFIVLWVILVLLGAAGVRVPGPFRLGAVAGGAAAAVPATAAGHLHGLLSEKVKWTARCLQGHEIPATAITEHELHNMFLFVPAHGESGPRDTYYAVRFKTGTLGPRVDG